MQFTSTITFSFKKFKIDFQCFDNNSLLTQNSFFFRTVNWEETYINKVTILGRVETKCFLSFLEILTDDDQKIVKPQYIFFLLSVSSISYCNSEWEVT